MKVYKGVILNKEKYTDTLVSGEKAEQVEESQCGRDTRDTQDWEWAIGQIW